MWVKCAMCHGLSRDALKALLQLLSSQVPQNVVPIAWKPGNVSSTYHNDVRRQLYDERDGDNDDDADAIVVVVGILMPMGLWGCCWRWLVVSCSIRDAEKSSRKVYTKNIKKHYTSKVYNILSTKSLYHPHQQPKKTCLHSRETVKTQIPFPHLPPTNRFDQQFFSTTPCLYPTKPLWNVDPIPWPMPRSSAPRRVGPTPTLRCCHTWGTRSPSYPFCHTDLQPVGKMSNESIPCSQIMCSTYINSRYDIIFFL